MSWRTFTALSASSAANHTHTISAADWGPTPPLYQVDDNLSAAVSAWLRAQRRDAKRARVQVAYDPEHGMWRLTVFSDDGTRGYSGPPPIVHAFSSRRVREQRGSGLMFICQEALAQFQRFPKPERKPRAPRPKPAPPAPLRVVRRMSFRKEGA